MPDDAHAEIETAIYEAAVLPELWPRALAEMNQFSDTFGTALVCVNERGLHLTCSPNMEKVCGRFVSENWMMRNTRGAAAAARGLVGYPAFLTEKDIYAPGEELEDPMVNELFRPEGLGRGAGFTMQLPHGDVVIVTVEQIWDRGPIMGERLERLNGIYTHLARATMLASRVDLQKARTAVETMSALGLPAAALTPKGRVVMANSEFDASQRFWTTGGGDRLVLLDRQADGLLASGLAGLTQATGNRSIPLRETPGGPVTAVLQLVPIRRSGADIFGSSAAIAVLSRPSAGMPSATLIQSLFDLTPTELAISRALAEGKTVAQIATQSGRSVNTVRNQLQSIMSKTGCTRQAELIILMGQLSGAPPAEQ
jgi:DNA-binding CsgD family transcriptional regulator